MIGSAGPNSTARRCPTRCCVKGDITVSGADGSANWTLKAAARRGASFLFRRDSFGGHSSLKQDFGCKSDRKAASLRKTARSAGIRPELPWRQTRATTWRIVAVRPGDLNHLSVRVNQTSIVFSQRMRPRFPELVSTAYLRSRLAMSERVIKWYTRAVLSSLLVTMNRLSGENAAFSTAPVSLGV